MSQVPVMRAYDEVIEFFARGPTRDEIAVFRLGDAAVARVRELLLKNSAGALSADTADELDQCVQLDRMLILIRSRARQELRGFTAAGA